MSNDLQVSNNYFLPTSFEQAERFAEKISSSALCPAQFKGKPADTFIAMQMGAEVGLSPMSSVQSIAVINGRPSIWGDALLAIIRVHKDCESVREWMEGNIKDESLTAYCGMKRRGQNEEIRSFSMTQAKIAGLWGKTGPWTNYKERMLQMRARGFCGRDVFPDALKGLHSAEESQDIIVHEPQPIVPKKMRLIEGTPLSQSSIVDADALQFHLDQINLSNNWDELKEIYKIAKEEVKGDKEASNKISKATKERQEYIKQLKKEEVKEPEQKADHSEFLAAYEGKQI